MSTLETISLTINGEIRQVRVQPLMTLLEVLRDQLQLTGSKKGCNQGVCGACTVMIDNELARACLSLAINCTDREIITIEGISDEGQPSVLQQAFIDAGAVQCGFCTSGMIVSANKLLHTNPNPDLNEIRQGLSGNVCRCSGYRKIINAVQNAAGDQPSGRSE